MSKYILVLKSSPRSKGNSSLLADQVSAGASAAGAQTRCFDLHQMNIRPCDACEACRRTNQCIIKDDMQQIYPEIVAADGIVFASPVYWFTFSAQMKLCLDRCYAFESPQGSRLTGKRLGLILTYGDADPYISGAVNAMYAFRDAAHYLQSEMTGIVYGTASKAGEVKDQPDLLKQAYELGKKIAR